MVEPTHLKHMLVKLDHFPKVRGENYIYTPQNKHGTWKSVPGKGDPYWKPLFSGSMLNLGGVKKWNHHLGLCSPSSHHDWTCCNSVPLSGLLLGQGHLPKHQHLIPLKIRDHTRTSTWRNESNLANSNLFFSFQPVLIFGSGNASPSHPWSF